MNQLTLDCARAGETLWIGGNIIPAMEKDLEQTLARYLKESKPQSRVIDMSAIRYLASSAARLMVTMAQGAAEQGAKIRLKASVPVVRTMSLMGAERWMEIEASAQASPKPEAAQAPVRPSSAGILPVADSTARPSSRTNLPAAKPGASGSGIAPAAHSTEYRPTVKVGPSSAEAPRPVLRPVQTSVGVKSAAMAESPDAILVNATALAGLPLASGDEAVHDALAVMRQLRIMGLYTFHIIGAKSDVTGKVLARIQGPWILVDCHGARRYVNLFQVSCIDVLAQ
jgi:anti-anti-sigma factor